MLVALDLIQQRICLEGQRIILTGNVTLQAGSTVLAVFLDFIRTELRCRPERNFGTVGLCKFREDLKMLLLAPR